MSDRLNEDSLADLPDGIRRPAYDRRAVKTGIVHLGIGAFHRAHQAVYTDDVLGLDPQWGIVAASLRSPDTFDALAPQDGLYTLSVRSREGEALRIIGSIRQVIVAPRATDDLLDAMADPRTKIVTLTVTEKGYCHDPATGTLNEAHPDIVHDLAYLKTPRSAPGFIVEALRRRRRAGVPPFTVLTCDNLPSNGRTVKRVLTRFAELVDPDLGRFVADEVSCPSTMVDRIVPATSDQDRQRIGEALHVEDAWPVVTEPFTQWVIEDRFPQGRPAWENAGAEFVADVEPYEHMKLRLLNGSHSTLAYLGYLAGYETVADTMADPAFVRLVEGLMDEEVTPTLHMPPGADLASYKRALVERFKNPALKHRTWQIAMDGSQKLPQRLLGTVRDRLRDGGSIARLSLGVAAWMRYVTGVDEKGSAIDVRDPMAARLRELADRAGGEAGSLANALFGIREIFGDDLANDPRFTQPVTAHLARLHEKGAKRTVAELGAE
ncbi:mannitol dehydrogenase family protein [Microvirga lotononidis]|uniref:Mannitol-1-phosphate/altronate dehydrogenase n=1 Tax=Microvirga lotononidis TaxID=864069 RepID=I4YL50_9HYPH|nr:mannitol dehydrogenase family protein [Microvirga lotononidis]EIM24692.1 mannitol-1-phosphate/altronate dehydrogenase [Microvirga lotononidis]WQO26703.1 mannitol dehydrogenase family protein [Microvirga lotononidis]